MAEWAACACWDSAMLEGASDHDEERFVTGAGSARPVPLAARENGGCAEQVGYGSMKLVASARETWRDIRRSA